MTNAFTDRFRLLLPLLTDVLVPIVLYLLLKRLGVGDFWALTLAGLATGVSVTVHTVRRRKLDMFGVLVLLEIALSVALLFVTDDPRIVAIKPSFYTALAAVFLLVTCFVGRPATYVAAQPLATRGDPVRTVAYRAAWTVSPSFRARQRLMTATFAVFLLAESVLRVVVVYHYSAAEIERSFLLSQLPGIVLLALVLLSFRLQVPALRRIVDGVQRQTDPAGSGAPGEAGNAGNAGEAGNGRPAAEGSQPIPPR
ncbi:hypothetical protein GCM10027187_21280 [Streptosporangium sandarakinum]